MLPIYSVPAMALLLLLVGSAVNAQTWVFLPSAAIDQRFDDNYRLETGDADAVSATRVVGNLGLNRESPSSQIRGLARADALLSVGQDTPDELDSNLFLVLDSNVTQPRSATGFRVNIKNDTPNRDISTDLTDIAATPSEDGAAVTQDQNVDRIRVEFEPSFSYNLSRRSKLMLDYSYTDVNHGDPSCEDALATFDPTGEQVNPVFTPNELDDFRDNKGGIAYSYQLSELSTFTTEVTFSRFEAEEEIPDSWVEFNDKIPDADCNNVRRNPRLPTTVDTTRFTVGYERKLSETLSASGQIGYYQADSRKLIQDNPNPELPRPALNPANPAYDPAILPSLYTDSASDGYLLNVSLSKKTGTTVYSGKIGVEVYPSDIGDVVESLEWVGDVTRQLNPRLVFNFRMRAFEPDAISDDKDDDEFARRFLSLEPKLVWNITRNWTVGGSYRYRRQKTQASPLVSESNALLLSLKFTPSSELGDLAK